MSKIELTVWIDDELAAHASSQSEPLDTVVENALRAYVDDTSRSTAEGRARQWADENAEAIKSYNDRIARRGTFGADLRRW